MNNICAASGPSATIGNYVPEDVVVNLEVGCGPAGQARMRAYRIRGVWWLREWGWDAIGHEGRKWNSRRLAEPWEVDRLSKEPATPATPGDLEALAGARVSTSTHGAPIGVCLVAEVPRGPVWLGPPLRCRKAGVWWYTAPGYAPAAWAKIERELWGVRPPPPAPEPFRVKRGRRRHR